MSGNGMASMHDKPEIIICLPHLREGGAERQALELAQDISTSRKSVAIVLLEKSARRELSKSSSIRAEYPGVNVLDWKSRPIPADLKQEEPAKYRRQRRPSFMAQLRERLKHTWRQIPWKWVVTSPAVATMIRKVLRVNDPAVFKENQLRELLAIFLTYPMLIVYLRRLNRYVNQNPVQSMISFLPKPNVVSLIVGIMNGIPVSISERNDFARNPAPDPIRRAQLITYPHAATLTANTMPSVEELEALFPENRVLWLPNSGNYRVSATWLSERGPNFCMISRLVPQKRIGLVIRAWAASRGRCDLPQLHIFGDGSERGPLEQLVLELGLGESVSLHGFIPIREIPLEKWQIGAFINSSSFEGSSNAIHEAVRLGLLPLVSLDVRELMSILEPELMGRLCFRSTVEDLSDAITSLVNDKASWDELYLATLQGFRRYWNDSDGVRRRAICYLASH